MHLGGPGQWLYFAWHLPALVLTLSAVILALFTARSLARDALSLRAQKLRWEILGGCAVFASALSIVVLPYLTAAATLRVSPDGTWRLSDYLGFPVAVIAPDEPRTVIAEDLGGRHIGIGRLTILRPGHPPVHSVRLSGETFDRLRRTLGYSDTLLRPIPGGVEIPAHRYASTGPRPWPALAVR